MQLNINILTVFCSHNISGRVHSLVNNVLAFIGFV